MLRKGLRLSATSWALFGWLLLAGCLPVAPDTPPIPPQPSATLTPPPTSTPTVIWFPLTSTPTPLSPALPVTPTLDQRPEQGELLFSDDFGDGSDWLLGQTATTSIAVGNHALTLALDQPDGYIYTLRKSPLLGDFYLEVTASPTLCRAADEYGLLLRVSENLDFFRFSLSCDGHVRLDKYFGGKASSPLPKSMSGAVPPGAPSSSRLAVWAKGKEMRFYINDQYQFTIKDGTLLRGSLGFFIRSGGENALTVSFSKLSVSKVTE